MNQLKDYFIRGIKSLSDTRVLGQFVFVVIVLLVSWSGVKAIQTNYDLQKQISKLRQEVAIAELENRNLELRNEYLETDHFLELAAREQFGKAAKGERVYIVPKDVALKNAPQTEQASEQKSQTDKPAYQKNLEAWTDFFFRKSDNKLIRESQ